MFIAANVCTFLVYMYVYWFDRTRQSSFLFSCKWQMYKKKKKGHHGFNCKRCGWREEQSLFSPPPHQKVSLPSRPCQTPIESSPLATAELMLAHEYERDDAKLAKTSNVTTRKILAVRIPPSPHTHFQSPFIREKNENTNRKTIERERETEELASGKKKT